MLSIVIPMAGESIFYSTPDNHFPKPFYEVLGRPMIEVVVENLMRIEGEKRFIFVINDNDAKKYRLDNVLRMLTKNQCEIVIQIGSTKGAVCSLLLAVKHLNDNNPILISNADQVISHDLNSIVNFFDSSDLDGGVVCFDSVHPQWSYARVIQDNILIETTEKQPISRDAIAGLYFFSRGKDFVESAMDSITKGRSYDGVFYTSSVLNEMILRNKTLKIYRIKNDEYHSFYNPEKIHEYENASKGI